MTCRKHQDTYVFFEHQILRDFPWGHEYHDFLTWAADWHGAQGHGEDQLGRSVPFAAQVGGEAWCGDLEFPGGNRTYDSWMGKGNKTYIHTYKKMVWERHGN